MHIIGGAKIGPCENLATVDQHAARHAAARARTVVEGQRTFPLLVLPVEGVGQDASRVHGQAPRDGLPLDLGPLTGKAGIAPPGNNPAEVCSFLDRNRLQVAQVRQFAIPRPDLAHLLDGYFGASIPGQFDVELVALQTQPLGGQHLSGAKSKDLLKLRGRRPLGLCGKHDAEQPLLLDSAVSALEMNGQAFIAQAAHAALHRGGRLIGG